MIGTQKLLMFNNVHKAKHTNLGVSVTCVDDSARSMQLRVGHASVLVFMSNTVEHAS